MESDPLSRLHISPSLAPKSPTRLGGKLLEAVQKRERLDKLEAWKNTLVVGECSISCDSETGIVTATRNDSDPVDITELLVPGSRIVRTRPEGDKEWSVRKLVEPPKDSLPYRLLVEDKDGWAVNFALTELMAKPNENDKSWVIPVPAE